MRDEEESEERGGERGEGRPGGGELEGMFRGLGSRVGIQGIGAGGDGAGLLDGVDGVFKDRENGEGKRS